MVLNMIIPFLSPLSANEDYLIVDDTVVSNTEENYFTYSAGTDENGVVGWSSSDANYGSDELKTQHWVWTADNTEASKHLYSFTFKGTGVELIGITPTGSDKNTFQMDDEEAQTIAIDTTGKKETVLYSRKDLVYGEHTVTVTLPNDGNQKGLQISYAKVFGSTMNEVEKTIIPHTKTTGTTNKFTFSDTGWSAGGNSEHIWSDTPSTDDPSKIWYQVDFIGHKIDIYAGKNHPMGLVKYYIDGREVGEYSLYNSSNINSTFITSIDGLEEGAHTFKAVATGKKDTNSTNTLIDCAQVVVYHAPYAVEDIILDSSSYKLIEGAKQQIDYIVSPDYATVNEVEYISDNTEVASVDEDGLISAKGKGAATITVYLPKFNITKIVTVTVTEAAANMGGSIVDTDTQYTQDRYNEVKEMGTISKELTAWKNDKAISEIALISKDCQLKNVTLTTEDLVDGENVIGKENIKTTFIKSTKAYNGAYLGYGDPNREIPADNGANRSESSDILYQSSPIDIEFNKVQPVWVEFVIPSDAKAGTYQTTITVNADGLDTPLEFTYVVNVQDEILNDASTFKNTFDIELWQYPYNSAEYYGVEPFSEEHLNIMRSGMEIYKSIGGHAITTTISEEAWAGQTYSANDVHYPSMIKWTKEANGSFTYDFTDFDKWVQFNKDLGIGDKIVLYSIAPWHNSFTYWENDQLVYERYTVGNTRYNQVWTDFLRKLIDHLMEKGWFDESYIGIDERGFSSAAFDLIDSVRNIHDQPLKTAGAMDGFVNKHDLALRVTDLNVGDTAADAHPAEFSKLVKEREALGYKTTLYSCTEHQPGNFSLSAPVESYWSIINAGQETAGFLRWAYDAWVVDPLNDTTHNSFEPGDCFLIYPDLKDAKNPISKSSVRLERMGQGMRDVNKIKQMVARIPGLQNDVDAMYAKLTLTANTSRQYLSKANVTKLAQEMNTFKNDLDALTEKYLILKENGTDEVSSVDILENDLQLALGNSKQLHATVNPSNVLNTKIDWHSSNSNIISVSDSGLISANGMGSAVITAISNQDPTKKDSITVTVTAPQIEESARVAYYSFDNNDATDNWGSRNGIVNGAGFAEGKSGNALYIEEENRNVTFNSDSGIGENDSWSISYWVKSTAPITDRISILMDANKDYSFDLKLASNRSAGYHVGKNSGDVLTFTYNFNQNEWYNVTWTQSKSTGLSMYVNGNLVNTNAWTKTNKALLPLDIIGGTGFTGYIDEIKVYNRVLNASEVNANMLLNGLNLTETSKTMFINDTYQIQTNLISDNDDKTITYTSSNSQVASVNEQGIVTALKRGTAKIIVENKAGGYRDEILITVNKNISITSKIPMYQLSEDNLSDIEKAPNTDRQYLGQPDMVRTKSGRLITAYPKGHGKGPLIMQISDDDGETWTEKTDTPSSWNGSQETPTIYILNLADGTERILLITACPGWGSDNDGNQYGWNTSYSDDNGETWNEYNHWYSRRSYDNADNDAIVAMASLVQLKDEDGNYIQKWMGVYHNYSYVNFKTYLTFDENGNEQWTDPVPYLNEYRSIESTYQMCEIGMFRSPDGKKIIGLARSQSHNNPSTLIYSDDEGETWSKPMDLPGSLAGERHKAAYDPISGRLVITFREIKYDLNGNNQFDGSNDWTCGEWIAWVGTYEDLMEQNDGEYRILLAEDWSNNAKSGDTGYAGVVVLEDGTFIMDSYGHWDKDFSLSWPNGVTTDLCYIKQAKFKLGEIENANNLVNREALNDFIVGVENTDSNLYTKESFAKFKVALDKAILVNCDNVSQQIQINAALESLIAAYNDLKFIDQTIDKTALQIAVDTANILKAQGALDNVVPAVVTEFETALANAEAVLADTSANQATIDSAFYRLANVIHMLEFVKGDKSALEALINEAKKYEEGNYTTDSWAAFKEALDAARDVMSDENALESDVNKALNNLTEAISNLVLRADKTRLQEVYDKVNGLDKSLYTEGSVANLVEPMANAKAVLDDADATQEAVDASYEALIRAYLDLRLIPNKDLLQGLINKAETLNATNYSAKTWSVMMEALNGAKATLADPEATQEEVDNAKEVLTKAMSGLEMIEASNPVKAGDTTASVATGDTTNMLYPLAGLAFATLAFYESRKRRYK